MAYTTINDPTQYFNTVLYSGNGTDDRSITGVGFQPDFLWVKNRSAANGHALVDTTRGATATLRSQASNAEETESNGIQAFESDGFQIGTSGLVNTSSNNYVSWNWLANGGTTSSNSDGSITSTVQANTTAGFSIVSWTGTGADATVGHGLGVAPKVYMIKARTRADSWIVGHTALGTSTYPYNLLLNQTSAKEGGSYDDYFTADASSTVLNLGSAGNVNGSSDTYIAYCFTPIKGYSKFGSYTGNGSTDGTFVYTGFKPAFVLIKRTTGTEDWFIYDSVRDTFNAVDSYLKPNTSGAEATASYGDLLSNGFKARNIFAALNSSGEPYIYMAFAESPFVSSDGVPTTAR